MFLKIQDTFDHIHWIFMLLHSHCMDNSLSFQSDFGDAVHSGRGKGIFEQGEIISPAVNLRRGQERAGDMVGDICLLYTSKDCRRA